MSLKATAEAPANLAFVKYWGKQDSDLRIPTNNSISVNLSKAKTITSVEFDSTLNEDQLSVTNRDIPLESDFSNRVFRHLDRMRSLAGINQKAIVHTQNTFPTGVGIASSASGFAALTIAACSALGLDLTEKELSEMARLGSGSACRSIPDGFTEWIAADINNSSYAVQIAPADHWDLNIVTVVVSKQAKQLSSTYGHSLAMASPFFKARLESLPVRLETVRSAILGRDFDTFGRETEMEAISFHSIAMTSPIQNPGSWISGAYYWLPESLELILSVQQWRGSGLGVYFTLDAGPTVHLICLHKDLDRVISAVHEVESSRSDRKWDILINDPAMGAHLIAGDDLE
ncbi:MAG: diphosphomevalonate decarboxylase [Chloroflexi bacterium GWB2_49_20]|nr:MAG: diphosphomevalonate decarboxylase [Chloroflexi bacterium GWB2_49_20]OGN76750.1 MAG: diphosphomevalonate decarboxylase [Chloroflexi bacterium GWC2_49_37]OGN83710.1 MAG: diphosphomevalonate decarboxylase [Chloroflexi bacterium GWD2_49_16]HBG74167.1 diphosphomevalonate decarboxylase [Anaerolineae bacterium]HCC79015.1 diphosphomevalonate decarboxylase [Anaerolineae bacterium]